VPNTRAVRVKAKSSRCHSPTPAPPGWLQGSRSMAIRRLRFLSFLLLVFLGAFASLPTQTAARGGADPSSGSALSFSLRVWITFSWSGTIARAKTQLACVKLAVSISGS
jgi:hypothetical protein